MVVIHRPHHRQPLERGPLSLRIHRAPELLGARGHGPIHATPCRLRRALRLFEAHRWTANLRILEIDDIKIVPHAPLSNPFVERLIGTVR